MSKVFRKCPNCNFDIDFGKRNLANCIRCKSCIMLVKIGKDFIVTDVTPARKVVDSNVT